MYHKKNNTSTYKNIPRHILYFGFTSPKAYVLVSTKILSSTINSILTHTCTAVTRFFLYAQLYEASSSSVPCTCQKVPFHVRYGRVYSSTQLYPDTAVLRNNITLDSDTPRLAWTSPPHHAPRRMGTRTT